MREPRAGTIARSAAMAAILVYAGAALAEIAGCFSFWAWLRLGKSALWILPGAASLAAFAWLLTRIDADFAGRAYAAHGGVYNAASRGWLWAVAGVRPGGGDPPGAAVRSLGAATL